MILHERNVYGDCGDAARLEAQVRADLQADGNALQAADSIAGDGGAGDDGAGDGVAGDGGAGDDGAGRWSVEAWRLTAVPERMRGGRAAAEAVLRAVDPEGYARSRNFLDGRVTGLSPYLRHGVLALGEVRDAALAAAGAGAEKLVQELAWREYWQRVYVALDGAVGADLEADKTGVVARARELPEDVREARTGLRCMDAWSGQLQRSGYLHNHARMWMAAYLVHWRRVRWQAGAAWFREHLLDGDAASNDLSWQWVASTFGSKPYFFNRENLERYTGGRFCQGCALAGRGCPMEGSYEDLAGRLFGAGAETAAGMATQSGDGRWPAGRLRRVKGAAAADKPVRQPLIWVHAGSLNPKQEALRRYPEAPVVFVWDEEWLERDRVSAKRLAFVAECLREMPERMWIARVERGGLAELLRGLCARLGADGVVAQETAEAVVRMRGEPVGWVREPRFCDGTEELGELDLRRFSRFWQRVQRRAMQSSGYNR